MRLRRYNSPLPSPPPSTHSFNTILEQSISIPSARHDKHGANADFSPRVSKESEESKGEGGRGGWGGKWKVSGLSQGEQTGWLDSRKVSLHAIGVTRSFEPEWRWSKQRRVKFLSDGSRGGSESGGRERVRERSLLDYAAPSSRLTSPRPPQDSRVGSHRLRREYPWSLVSFLPRLHSFSPLASKSGPFSSFFLRDERGNILENFTRGGGGQRSRDRGRKFYSPSVFGRSCRFAATDTFSRQLGRGNGREK